MYMYTTDSIHTYIRTYTSHNSTVYKSYTNISHERVIYINSYVHI